MPMIGRCDDHRLDTLVLKHPAKIGVTNGLFPGCRNPFFPPAAMRFRDAEQIHVAKLAKRFDVPFPDQPITDQADADAFGRAQNTSVACRAQGNGACRRCQEIATIGVVHTNPVPGDPNLCANSPPRAATSLAAGAGMMDLPSISAMLLPPGGSMVAPINVFPV